MRILEINRRCALCGRTHNYSYLVSYNSFTRPSRKLVRESFNKPKFQLNGENTDYSIIERCSCGFVNFNIGNPILGKEVDKIAVSRMKAFKIRSNRLYLIKFLNIYNELPLNEEEKPIIDNLLHKLSD